MLNNRNIGADLRSMFYFWREKGDLTRWCEWEEAKAFYPDIRKAWKRYKKAERSMDAAITATYNKYLDDED